MNEKKPAKNSFGKNLRDYFIAGLLVIVPLGATILILIWVFNSIDHILEPIVTYIFGYPIPGIGFAATIVLIFLAGVVAKNFIGKKIIAYGDSLLNRVPVFRALYNGIKQILQAFAAPDKAGFMQVVLVEFPREGMWELGFVTNEFLDENGDKLFSVLLPTSPTPTSGFLQIVREKDVVHTNISVDAALKMIVSAGTMTPEEVRRKVHIKEKL